MYEPHKRALSSVTSESSQLSLAISESEVEVETDIEKKPLEPIPEGREDVEGGTADVIQNPNTSHEDGSSDGEDEGQEEITRM